MRVIAKLPAGKFGFYGGRRIYDGTEFNLSEESHFSKKWMTDSDGKSQVDSKAKGRGKGKAKKSDESVIYEESEIEDGGV